MMDSTAIGDLIENMVTARYTGDQAGLIGMLHELVAGPVMDALNVCLVMAGILSEEFAGEPEGGFHRVAVTHVDEDGVEHEGSASDLPPHVAIFAQMVAALANGDRQMAVDLFIGYIGTDGIRALGLLVFALNEVVHLDSDCPQCRSDTSGPSPA